MQGGKINVRYIARRIIRAVPSFLRIGLRPQLLGDNAGAIGDLRLVGTGVSNQMLLRTRPILFTFYLIFKKASN